MTEKRYYEKKYGDEFYIFDSNTISEKEFEEKLDLQGYKVFEDSLTGKEVVDLLNENEQLKKVLSDVAKDREVIVEDLISWSGGLITELEEENEKLKSDRVRFEEETRLEITRRLDKVFDCIDKKINNLQRKYDFGQQEAGACPMHNLKHSINTLKELKKELEE